MSNNINFQKAKEGKNDEFYTKITDIENELLHYRDSFKNKHIFLNCDDPDYSNFWKFFFLNFTFLELKHLTATHFEESKPSFKLDYYVNELGQLIYEETDLKENGDFRSPESLEILKECDIVVTNPPFSLFRTYIATLMENEVDFLIIGNQNNVTYKDVFPLLKSNKMWLGINSGSMEFQVPNDGSYKKDSGYREDEDGNAYRKFGNICWYTNIDHDKRHEEVILYKAYNEEDYPKYVNYDAIEVSRVKDIPVDYFGEMGVPVTFLNKYNPEQFEIIDISSELAQPMKEIAHKGEYMSGGPRFYIKQNNNKYIYKRLYDRIVIKRK